MRIVDFKQLKVVEADVDYNLSCNLMLDALLDEPYSKYMEGLSEQVSEFYKRVVLRGDATNFNIYTDLSDDDLEMVKDNIKDLFIEPMLNRQKLRHEERRLGLPEELVEVDVLYLTLMDLVNYETKTHAFNISLYNKNKEFYDSIVRKEAE